MPSTAKSSAKKSAQLSFGFSSPFETAPSRPKTPNGTGFNDPAFAANKTLPIHRWVPWIAGFSKDFVQGAIRTYLPDNQKGMVLDPFSGVGTTLVEATLLGHNAVGFEINPYAALACRLKVTAYRINVAQFRREIARYNEFQATRPQENYTPKTKPPEGFRSRAEFYSPKVLHKVLVLHDFISTLEAAGDIRDMFRLAFLSTMVRYSNYSYEPSLGRRVSAGKEEIEDYDVAGTITDKLQTMADDILWVQSQLAESCQVNSRVINQSFFTVENHLEPGSVDLIITSPPYLNNYHYNRNTRPHLYWLGFASTPSDMRPLEEGSFGKYWQTVRELPLLDLDFDLPGTDIKECLAQIRSLNPDRGIYGGNGWANYAAAYFNDCRKFMQGVYYSLKSGGTALIVIGNSIIQGVMMPTDRYLAQIGKSVGLELVDIHIPRATRVGNSIIQSDVRVGKAGSSHQLYEAVVELRR